MVWVSEIREVSIRLSSYKPLPNPTLSVGFGRTADWNTNTAGPPSPVDNFNYSNHAYDTMLFGRRITAANIRRVIRRIDWEQGNVYEQYRHDYSVSNLTQTTGSTRLYDARYYVMNSDFRVYICIENGATPSNPAGNSSQDEPNFTDLEPTRAGDSGDGYVWKYLFTVNPSDIIKFDSTEYITLPSMVSVLTLNLIFLVMVLVASVLFQQTVVEEL